MDVNLEPSSAFKREFSIYDGSITNRQLETSTSNAIILCCKFLKEYL